MGSSGSRCEHAAFQFLPSLVSSQRPFQLFFGQYYSLCQFYGCFGLECVLLSREEGK